jgi:ABC-type sugar transport system ATPase subunit
VGEVVLTEPLGVETVIHVRSGQQSLLSIAPGITDLKIGDAVHFTIVRERLHYFDPDGARI